MKKETGKPLSTLLWELSRKTIQKVEEYRAKGALVQTKTLYVKRKVDKFDYDKGTSSHRSSFEYVEKEEWHWTDQFEFIEKVVKEFTEYLDCVKEISKRCDVIENQAEFWLSRFIQILSREAVEGISDESLVDHVTTFIGDIDKAPVEWNLKVWLEGIWPEDKKYELETGVILRQPNASDLEVENPFELFPAFYSPLTLPQISSSVMEFTFRCKESIEVQREIELLLDVLRLFRLGSVSAVRTEMQPKSFINPGGVSGPNLPRGTPYRYKFTLGDVEKLTLLIRRVKPLLPQPFDASSTDLDPLTIAFQRYKDALLQHGTIEGRITSVITCLEALYLKSEERAELSHRLAQRVSALLRHFNFKSLEVFNKISEAYEIRSSFIHGSHVEKEKQQSAGKLWESIMEYARVSLLTFFQLKDTLEKERIINKLDNSLLDQNALQKTKEDLSKDILIST